MDTLLDELRTGLDGITVELRSMREEIAQVEQDRSEREVQPGPPIYSNWVLIAVTLLAVVAAFWTLRILKRQTDASIIAARAAKTSADVSAAQLSMLYRPSVDIRDLKPTYLGKRAFEFLWNIYNAGSSPVRFLRIDATHRTVTGKDNSSAMALETTRGPGRGFGFPVVVELEEEDLELYLKDRLLIDMQIHVEVDHPVGQPFWLTFTRRITEYKGQWNSQPVSDTINGWKSRGRKRNPSDTDEEAVASTPRPAQTPASDPPSSRAASGPVRSV